MNSEIFDIAQEEAAEVIVALSKIRRFGLESIDPRIPGGKTNQQSLEEELGDMLCMINLLIESGFANRDSIEMAAKAKEAKLRKWSNIFN